MAERLAASDEGSTRGAPPSPTSPTSSGGALAAREFGNRYATVEVLAEHDLGKLHRALDRSRDNQPVALHVLLARENRERERIDAFFADVRTARELSSPHLAEILDAGELEDGRLFLACELVDGESLRARLVREGTLRPQAAAEIARQVLIALAGAHDRGLTHGRVLPDQIWLEARVPKTAENPEGIRARLFGLGLSALRESDERATAVARDLRSVAALLAAMLTGCECDPRSAAGELANVPASAHALVARGLGLPGSTPFSDARAFAQAIAMQRALPSLAPQAARASPLAMRWAMLGGTSVVIAVLVAVFWALEQQSDVLASKSQAAQVELERMEILRAQETQCYRELEVMHAMIQEREAKIAALLAQVDGATERGETLGGDGRDERALEQVRVELERMRGELDDAKDERTTLLASLQDTQRKAREAEAQAASVLAMSTPEGKLARGVDRLIGLIAKGEGARAVALVDQLGADGSLRAADAQTRGHFAALAQCAAALQQLAERGPDPATLEGARAALATARATETAFVAEASWWIEERLTPGDDPKRQDGLREIASGLDRKIADAADRLDRAHEDDWDQLAQGDRAGDPSTIARHATRFACGHLDRWMHDAATELERELVRSGKLDLQRLCASQPIASWQREIDGQPSLRAGVGARALLDLIEARDWYCGGAISVAAGSDADEAPVADDWRAELGSDPRDHWRAALALERALLASDSAYPCAAGLVYVYRDQDLARATTTWYVDELITGSAREGSWDVRRRVYTQDGTAPASTQTLSFSRREASFVRAGRTVLELRRAQHPAIAIARPEITEMPSKSWFPSREELARFHAELERSPEPCLVVREGSLTRVVSPRLGLVAEEDVRSYRLQLVYVGAKGR